jgi:hypothetical protein
MTLLPGQSFSCHFIELMETSILVKFFAAAGIGYVFLLGTAAGSLPPSIAAAGLALAWFVGRNATS